LNAVEVGRTPLVFIGFPFIYNYLLLMGFYNYSLSVALLMLVMGYWWKHSATFGVRDMAILGLLLVLLYFCHLVSLVLALFSIAAVAILSLAPKLIRWKRAPLSLLCILLLVEFYSVSLIVALLILVIGYRWKYFGAFDRPKLIGWRQTSLSLLCMLPAIGLTLYYTETRGTAQSGSWELARLWQYFIRNESLAYYSKSQIIIGKFVTGAFVALFSYTLIRDHFFTKDPRCDPPRYAGVAKARKWRFGLRVHRKDFFLLLCAAFFVIYLKAPDGMSGGGFIKTRLAFLPFLIIIPWLSWDMPKIAKGIAGGALIVLATVYLAHASYYHKILSDDMKVYTSGYDVVERNKVVLPLGFDYIGRSWRIGIFVHPLGYYGYERGCINLINYEATTDYFPTIFKPDFHRPALATVHLKQTEVNFAEYADDIDYVITWALAAGSDVETRILEYYSLIKQNGNLKIFRRTTPDDGRDNESELATDQHESWTIDLRFWKSRIGNPRSQIHVDPCGISCLG
jgi:hypothetical protein